jgi:cyclase
MLKKRIIPCLDVKNGRTVKGINFEGLKDAGCALELAKKYSDSGADELVFLDISATSEGRKTMVDFAKQVGKKIAIPFTIGGGIKTVDEAEKVILAGADKVGVNSSAVKNPELLTELSQKFGAQAVVLAVDAKLISKKGEEKKWEVFVSGGKKATGLDVIEWVQKGENLGAGEILLTSMDQDGVKNGFDLDLLNAVCKVVSIPVIASGGAGKKEDFSEVFEKTPATAALAASVFHFDEIQIPELKKFLENEGVAVRV